MAGKPGDSDRLFCPAPWPWVCPASLGSPSLSPQALLALLCWLWHGLAHPSSWLQPPGPPATPPGSPPYSLLLDSSHSSNWDDDSIGWVSAQDGWVGVGKWAVIVANPHIEVQAPWELVVNWDPSHKLGPVIPQEERQG